ncbi:YdcF family protein [Gloeocapsa sp. PCC 73106]|uniref:YdcF family protein n=1 Tax=Gloeocapsa sp. PCC 73106 TaxID=102232 RepID=UPI0002AC1341|nr:YdcF family protein [Gloeocapsa sp. PCC 73106]ELR99056.1 hypothetical protein GLO73106DRAFT_00029010 [Gloeocapsa sp. PCC 73106]
MGIIPIRLIITLKTVPQPQAILILGGNVERIQQGIEFAKTHPDLDIWISCRPNACRYLKPFVNQERVYYDYCATDTLSNFICTLQPFLDQKIRYVYLLTSDYHLPRSSAIATIIFGSHGIAVEPISLPSDQSTSESWLLILRDSLRSLVWLIFKSSNK